MLLVCVTIQRCQTIVRFILGLVIQNFENNDDCFGEAMDGRQVKLREQIAALGRVGRLKNVVRYVVNTNAAPASNAANVAVTTSAKAPVSFDDNASANDDDDDGESSENNRDTTPTKSTTNQGLRKMVMSPDDDNAPETINDDQSRFVQFFRSCFVKIMTVRFRG
jgi:hypothetical protein